MTVNVRVLYLRLLLSIVGLFESRGESRSSARYAASLAMTGLTVMNIVALVLFAYALGRLRWFRIFLSLPINFMAVAALVALNWWLIGRIQRDDVYAGDLARQHAVLPITRLWLWYLIASMALMFVGLMLALLRM